LGCSGKWEEGIGYAEKAVRLAPFTPVGYLWILGRAYYMTNQYDKAIETFKKAVQINPDFLVAHAFLTASYSELDRQTEAAAEAEEVLRINPKFSLKSYAKTLPYKNKADIERYLTALRKAGLPEHPPLKLPDKPSIAVLAFDNMSGDPKQEYFSDGITEEIITALSRIRHLFVIARTSSFKYKGKDVDIRMVGRELGVRYVLEGSVRIAEDKVRITAQLIDSETNSHIWAERFERDMKDIFALQDEITVKIINALEVKLTAGEQARLWGQGTTNLNAYLKALEAREHHHNQTKEGNILARRLAEDAIALDPEYPTAYHLLALTHMQEVWLGTTKSPKQSLQRAVELAQKAIALDDSYAHAHGLLGFLYTTLRQHEKGIEQAEKAVALDPNGATVHYFLSYALRYAGRFEEAVQVTEKSIRLNPFPPVIFFRGACIDYIGAGRYEEAIAAAKNAVKIAPNDFLAHMMLATAYSVAGREEEAQAAAEEVLRINPKFSLEYFKKIFPFKNEEDLELLIGAMRKAGLSG